MPEPKARIEDQKALEEWLRRYLEHEYFLGRVLAGGSLLLGLGVLAFNFFVIYAVIYLFADLSRSALMLLSLLGLAVLFYAHAHLCRSSPEEPPVAAGAQAEEAAHPPQPEWIRLLFKIIPAILFQGPRLIGCTWQTYLRIETYEKSFNVAGCAAALAELLANYRRVDFQTLQASLPGLDLEALLPQLKQIQGVQFITNLQPPGVTLTDSLREELLSLDIETPS